MNTRLQTVYNSITHDFDQHGYPPHVVEIATVCALQAGIVHACLDRLEAHYQMTRLPGKAFSIWLALQPSSVPSVSF